MPRLVSRLAVGVAPLSSCTTLNPSYKKVVVVPLIVLLLRRPTASYWKLVVRVDQQLITLISLQRPLFLAVGGPARRNCSRM